MNSNDLQQNTVFSPPTRPHHINKTLHQQCGRCICTLAMLKGFNSHQNFKHPKNQALHGTKCGLPVMLS
jgi:hypothetical protein